MVRPCCPSPRVSMHVPAEGQQVETEGFVSGPSTLGSGHPMYIYPSGLGCVPTPELTYFSGCLRNPVSLKRLVGFPLSLPFSLGRQKKVQRVRHYFF